MAVFDRREVLMSHCSFAGSHPWTSLVSRVTRHASLVTFALFLQGCGLIFDAVQFIYPVSTDELDAICRRGKVQVGMAAEPFRPFVFPAVWTDEGARVTGLDAELVREVSDALTSRCGTPVAPVLHLVRFHDLFLLLSEGQLDFFVSAVAAGVPAPTRAGFAYSSPYFEQGGLSGISQRPEVLATVRARLSGRRTIGTVGRVLDGLTVAVQDGTAAHAYADTHLKGAHLIVCDSLPAAFEYSESGTAVDVILGAQPVLEFVTKTTRRNWFSLTREEGRALLFTESQYAIVIAEESYKLRWFVNDVIFQLRQTGRLDAMRHRWLDETYAYPRRASTEGLPFDVAKMPAHYAQGTCRETAPR
jgi:polar amino acid transport system substrate-binding protein